VALVGPGAIGLVVATALVDAGHRPLVAARTPFERIVHRLDDTTIEVDAGTHFDLLTDPGEVPGPVDLVIVATKIPQTSDAAPWLEALCGDDTVLAGVQNGIDHRERLSTWVPPQAVVPVVVNLPAEREAPGVVASSSRSSLAVPDDAAGQRLATALEGSFLPVRPLDDEAFATASWTKLVVNSAIGILAVLTGAPNGVIADPDARWLFNGLVEESAEVGRAEGADLPEDLADRLVERIMGGAPEHRSSIAVDRAAGRPTEWRARNQIVVDLAERHGIDVPLNRAGTALIRLGEPS
jgi:2-dehydropantoate 2-reductase